MTCGEKSVVDLVRLGAAILSKSFPSIRKILLEGIQSTRGICRL